MATGTSGPTTEPTRETRPAEDGFVVAAVLFDLDGTLIDSTPAVTRCWHGWCEEHGIAPSALVNSHGRRAVEIIGELLPTSEVAEAVRRLDELELADLDGVTALPGAATALASLAEGQGAIVTSAVRALALARLAAGGLVPPTTVVTADDVQVGKPDPEPYLTAARRLGVNPADCLVVEDAAAGVASAKAAGMQVLGVLTNPHVTGLAADLVVRSLDEVSWDRQNGAVAVRVRG
ncbi:MULTISPECIES: HAD-IA family hydrolase [Actinoalloteichus]|uniref:Haloacid dehalogenase superfamily enzyme, subfamily IA n=1 Tax=Actinoalloteichus fjordicus TaxID=1612552 RepID=A0AAC9PV69_9PSEU|nr:MULTISPECIES: HAD-IA family hydrolase [Actinoalloteichus]APU17948.1 haloacid dehalogenase superfamily enzyme, subfamily IA [Actinoalloteichus fjordicus]APU24027.1 haloacid dehalogenase superfamily enzyme, subfamily IA [Actinoalloteichus sp. GBA129-24]